MSGGQVPVPGLPTDPNGGADDVPVPITAGSADPLGVGGTSVLPAADAVAPVGRSLGGSFSGMGSGGLTPPPSRLPHATVQAIAAVVTTKEAARLRMPS